jgi:hypothetical protein
VRPTAIAVGVWGTKTMCPSLPCADERQLAAESNAAQNRKRKASLMGGSMMANGRTHAQITRVY